MQLGKTHDQIRVFDLKITVLAETSRAANFPQLSNCLEISLVFQWSVVNFEWERDHLWNFREIPELEREAWTFYSANKKYKLFHCFFLLIWKQLTQGEIDLRAATSDFLCFIRLDRVLRRITFFVLVLTALTKRLDSENIQWVKGLEIFFSLQSVCLSSRRMKDSVFHEDWQLD